MIGRDHAELRSLLRAQVKGKRAARVEATARRRVDRAGDIAAQNHTLPLTLLPRIRDRHRRQQGLGVGVLRRGEQLGARRKFSEPPQIHHGNPVAHVTHDRQVVGYEEVREIVSRPAGL